MYKHNKNRFNFGKIARMLNNMTTKKHTATVLRSLYEFWARSFADSCLHVRVWFVKRIGAVLRVELIGWTFVAFNGGMDALCTVHTTLHYTQVTRKEKEKRLSRFQTHWKTRQSEKRLIQPTPCGKWWRGKWKNHGWILSHPWVSDVDDGDNDNNDIDADYDACTMVDLMLGT